MNPALKNLQPQPKVETEDKSDLAKAIEACGRVGKSFPVVGLTGMTETGIRDIQTIYFQRAVKAEEDDAVIAAHKYAATRAAEAGPGAEAARQDMDILLDTKQLEILSRVCRRDDDRKYPAFPGPEWMRKNLATDQIGMLIHLYNEMKKAVGPTPEILTDDNVDALMATVMAASDPAGSVIQRVLASLQRDVLTEAFVKICVKYDVLKNELTEAMLALDAQREELQGLRGEPPMIVAADA
jgi:uncharacterized protein YbaA (DUF1428 family)